jgi:hypothetical protein
MVLAAASGTLISSSALALAQAADQTKQSASSPRVSPRKLAEPTRGANPEAAKDNQLRKELLQRMTADQAVRKQMISLMNQYGMTDPAEFRKLPLLLNKELLEIDRQNRARMKEIVATYGWPGKTLVGVDGAQAAWLLVQHTDADRGFQKKCLTLMLEGVKTGEVSPEHLAYLTDRVRVAENQKQLYGTQFRPVNNKMEPYPIEDEANLDDRRRKAGLSPMSEYRKLMDAISQFGKPGAAHKSPRSVREGDPVAPKVD